MKEAEFCCCGCDLRTGTLILTNLSAVGGFVTFVIGLVALGRDGPLSNTWPAMRDFQIVVGIFVFLFGCIGTFGAWKYRPAWIQVYVLWMLIRLLGGIVFMFIFMASVPQYCEFVCRRRMHEAVCPMHMLHACIGATRTSQIVGIILVPLIESYFIWVVYSLWRKVRRGAISAANPSGYTAVPSIQPYQQSAPYNPNAQHPLGVTYGPTVRYAPAQVTVPTPTYAGPTGDNEAGPFPASAPPAHAPAHPNEM